MRAAGVTTEDRLVAAAAALLDAGGEKAVTLRAVGQGAGVSHNAPYKHFRNRDALLAAIATADFTRFGDAFAEIRGSSRTAKEKLRAILEFTIEYAHDHPMRYQLLFANRAIAAQGGVLQEAAMRSFEAFAAVVEECQAAGVLPGTPHRTLAGLLFASLHGLLAFEANGLTHPRKGFIGVSESIDLLVDLISRSDDRR